MRLHLDEQSPMRPKYLLPCLFFALAAVVIFNGCQRRTRDQSESILREMNSRTLRTDSLRQGLRYLSQTSPGNKTNLSKETRVLLNTWLKSVEGNSEAFTTSKLLAGLDPKFLTQVGCESAESSQFGILDVDYLYQCQMMNQLSRWIVKGPVRDRQLQAMLEAKLSELSPEEAQKLESAYKLFDWTIRNVKLAGVESSQVTIKTLDARAPLSEGAAGVANLPWQSLLFCNGDFVERGRVFAALAAQQGIEVCWISVGAAPGEPGHLFAMGVLAGGQLLLVEPKLGLPILNPDNNRWATLQDAVSNDRVTRRLSLPQYTYAFDKASIRSVQLLIDAIPFAASRRARLLENSLTGEERMVVAVDLDAMAERLSRAAPSATVALWQTPMLAQLYSVELNDRLGQMTEFTMRYMSEHAIWLLENSISTGRLLHLNGRFEKTLDTDGALKTYMETRVDDESLKKLAYNPDVQRALGLIRGDNESREQFENRVAQAQGLFSRAKFDAAFLLAQLHFDRGDYTSSIYWLKERVIHDPRSQRWHAAGWYTLARGYIETESFDLAEEALIQPSLEEGSSLPPYVVNPQDAGNRLRLRMLRQLKNQEEIPAAG